ncbi:MAG: norR 1 [Anaerosporomusa subterranea]|jgi:transcriptional regulator with PAS, ATPase and Fis domain|nr:norR 1 [Anaerosporomusa subterranea]
MGKITFFVPYLALGELVKTIFAEMDDGSWQLDVVLVTGVREIGCDWDQASDICVARGVTAAALKRLNSDMPVVDLQVTGYDIMRAVRECQRLYPEDRIAIAGSHDMIYGAMGLEEILGIEQTVIEVQTEEDAEPSIAKLKQLGIGVVAGGVMSTQIAERLGMHAVFIQTGREAIYQALREAKRMAQVRRQEQERGEQFRAILEYSTDGIIAVDDAGKINLINAAALKLTEAHANVLGYPSGQIFPHLGLSRVLQSGRPELGGIETLNSHQVAVNRVPVLINDQIVGAVATFQPATVIQELEGKIRQKIYARGLVAKLTFKDVLGDSPAIKKAIAVAHKFSRVDSNVLIVGESGTGKEVFTQSIHNASRRAKGPFVAVNCAALPESLLESELFGYAEGAFTGAVRGGKVGLFELAHGGTIFLDEVSEISPGLQGRLLRVLQEREIMRLGDSKVIPIDVRVIAATNRDLNGMMRQKLFREDLYYRVDVLRLTLPPLRDRQEDISPLICHFLKLYYPHPDRPFRQISKEAITVLLEYTWPGNVRELRNIAERLAVLNNTGVIRPEDLYEVLPRQASNVKTAQPSLLTMDLCKNSRKKEVLLQTLESTDYHYGKTAASLGISRTTLWRRIKQLGIEIADSGKF